jgi:hypothetical protein
VLPFGSMTTDPYARWMNKDFTYYEAILIHNRTASPTYPWYQGNYKVGVTDWFTSSTNFMDAANVAVMVWKDGVIKTRVGKDGITCGTNKHWWFPLSITAGVDGPVYYTATPDACGTLADAPY